MLCFVSLVVAEDILDLTKRLHCEEPLFELRSTRKSLHVPAEVLSKFDRRATQIGLVLLRHSSVLDRNRKPLFDRRRGRLRLALEQCAGLIEDPRLAERSTRNHHRCASCETLHLHCIFRSLDVTVSNYRDFERLHHRCNFFPPRGAAVHLRPCTWMNRQRTRARLLTPQRNRDWIAHLLVPSASDLHRDRQMCVLR